MNVREKIADAVRLLASFSVSFLEGYSGERWDYETKRFVPGPRFDLFETARSNIKAAQSRAKRARTRAARRSSK